MKGAEMAIDYKRRYEELVSYIKQETQAAKESSDMYFDLYDEAATDGDREYWFTAFKEANDHYHTLFDIKYLAERPELLHERLCYNRSCT